MVVVVVLTSKVLQQEECQVTLGKEDGDCVAGEKKVLPLQRECQRCVVVRSGNTRILGDFFFRAPHPILIGRKTVTRTVWGCKRERAFDQREGTGSRRSPLFFLALNVYKFGLVSVFFGIRIGSVSVVCSFFVQYFFVMCCHSIF